jgi:lipoprotein-anchoring transpeptidase ErfK/SrfK
MLPSLRQCFLAACRLRDTTEPSATETLEFATVRRKWIVEEGTDMTFQLRAFQATALLAKTAALSLILAGGSSAVRAGPLAIAPSGSAASAIFAPVLRDNEPGFADPGLSEPGYDMPARLRRQVVGYPNNYAAGTLVIDTANTYLYLVQDGGKALRYGIGVGREGFTWSGVQTISRMAEWPDWSPPPEMIRRQPYLPRFVAGGPGNPLGARALYLGQSQFRIHGTNDPSTIGHRVSSGCIRLTNEDVSDLYGRVRLGATVVVLPGGGRSAARDVSTRDQARPMTIAGPDSNGSGSNGISDLY